MTNILDTVEPWQCYLVALMLGWLICVLLTMEIDRRLDELRDELRRMAEGDKHD